MAKLYSSEEVIKVLRKKGFSFVSQKGSHIKLRKKHGKKTYTVIIPADRKAIPRGTFGSILRQAGLKKEDFR